MNSEMPSVPPPPPIPAPEQEKNDVQTWQLIAAAAIVVLTFIAGMMIGSTQAMKGIDRIRIAEWQRGYEEGNQACRLDEARKRLQELQPNR